MRPVRTPRSRSRRLPALAASFALALAIGGQTPAATPGGPDRAAPVRLKVMEFNIEYGGEVVDFRSVIRAIRESGADVVGIEEAWANTARIARRLGWDYFDPRMQIVSRLPLMDPPEADGLYTFVEIEPGRVVAVGNVHLPSYPYSPQRILLGATAREALAFERTYRVPAVRPSVHALSALAAAGIPSFLVGDFNAPSDLDWTSRTVGTRPQIRFPLAWPVSEVMERHGFVDSYRRAHPDPLRRPGITWPSGRPRPPGSYDPGPNAPQDRIDFVYAAGPAVTVRSTLVGESGAPGVRIAVDPWGSDHRAVLSTFDVRPGMPPTFVSVGSRVVTAGVDLSVTFHAPGGPGERVTIVPAGGDPGSESSIAEQATGGDAPTDGTLVFPTGGISPGAYEAVLSGAAGELARIPFWVRAAGAGPQIGTTRGSYVAGEAITVTWTGAPGNRWDWVGIYEEGADPNVSSYLAWGYTGATIEGSAVFDRAARGAWPLPAGGYSVYLLADDSYRSLASGTFVIEAG